MEVDANVTERKALALAEAADQTQRDFLVRMNHEIRTPMNGVLGMTRLAMQAAPARPDEIPEKKSRRRHRCFSASSTTFSTFSRIEAGKLTIEKHPFDLHKMIENIRELILPRIKEHDLMFTTDVDPAVPNYPIGDELRLSQVLLNLLGNASKFTLEGEISLRLAGPARPTPKGNFHLICEVSDSGIDMSLEQQEALFSPFTQADVSTSRKFGGTGLGLSISKAPAELMGGEINVTSEEGVRTFLDKNYSLILMDVRMPVMDGLEATRVIRARSKHDARTVPIIAMTANAMMEDRLASKEAGMNGHVAKPIDLKELKAVLFQKLKAGKAEKTPNNPSGSVP